MSPRTSLLTFYPGNLLQKSPKNLLRCPQRGEEIAGSFYLGKWLARPGRGQETFHGQIIHVYALAAGIEKQVYPHLFRHQFLTFLTRQGIISPKLQLLSGHAEEKNLAIYRDLALADVSVEYEKAMWSFPVR